MDSGPTSSQHSSEPKNFGEPASSKTSQLLQEIESLLPQGSYLHGSVVPLMSGAGVAVVQQGSGFTVVGTMPCGMHLWWCPEEVDVTTVESVLNLLRAHTEDQGDTISPMDLPPHTPLYQLPDNPASVDAANRLDELEDIETFLQALHEIAIGSEEGETVRIALGTLSSTNLGREYLKERPVLL